MSRVLFLSIPFYGYPEEISKAIKNNITNELETFVIEPTINIIEGLLTRISFLNYKNRVINKWQKSFFDKQKNKVYDIVFVLVGRELNTKLFQEFYKDHENARYILYLWDDVKRIENFFEIKDFFEVIYSFDRYDCEKYGFRFLPLFYSDSYLYRGEQKKIDISFVGWCHSDRLKVIENIIKCYEDENIKWFISINAVFIQKMQIIFQRKYIDIILRSITRKKLSIAENATILKQSRVVIDIQHPTQKGLTMRTFEALAAKTKLITTNTEVRLYDFYNPNNIYIIDRDNPMIDLDFLNNDYEMISENIIQQYSIDNWIKCIFDIK